MEQHSILAALAPPQTGGSGILALRSGEHFHLFIFSSPDQLSSALDTVSWGDPLDRSVLEHKLNQGVFVSGADNTPLVHLEGPEAETIGIRLARYCADLEKHGVLSFERHREYSRIRTHLLPRLGTSGAGILAVWHHGDVVYIYHSLEELRQIISSNALVWLDDHEAIQLHTSAQEANLPTTAESSFLTISPPVAEPIARALEMYSDARNYRNSDHQGPNRHD